jgi:hypothetical protein
MGRVGCEYKAVTLALRVSACITMALKSFTLMPIWIMSSAAYSSKSKVSMAMEVCSGCLRISAHRKIQKPSP